MAVESIFREENKEIFLQFMFYGGLIGAKMISMTFVTGLTRLLTKSFMWAEDSKMMTGSDKNVKSSQIMDRAMRCQMNEIESGVPFIILAPLYIGTSPSFAIALWHFRIYLLGRIFHTIFYLGGIQPARAIAFSFSNVVNISMAFQVIIYACTSSF